MFKLVYRSGFLTKLFLGLLAFVFIIGTAVMFGPGSWNFGFGNFVAKVGDITITPKEYRLQLIRLQQLLGNKVPESKLKELALNILVTQAVFAYLAEHDGFYPSKEEIELFIKKSFSVNGTFSPQLFERYLKETRLTPREFEEIIKKQLLATKYKKAVYTTSYVNDKTLQLALLPYSLTVKAEIYTLTPEMVKDKVKITEQFLRDFYNKTAKNWVEIKPERVVIYKLNNKEEVKKLYENLTENKPIGEKPYAVISPDKVGELKEPYKSVILQALRDKKPIVKRLNKGEYVLAVYRGEERKVLSFDEVKNLKQFREAAVLFKSLEYLNQNAQKLGSQILKGSIKAPKIEKELTAFELMKGFNFSLEDLLALLKGKKVFVKVNNKGLFVIRVIGFYQKNINPELVKLTEQQLRKSDYTKRLENLFNYDIRSGFVVPQVNQNYMPKYQK